MAIERRRPHASRRPDHLQPCRNIGVAPEAECRLLVDADADAMREEDVADTSGGGDEHWAARLHARLDGLEHLLQPEARALRDVESGLLPAWRRLTEGEPRWPVSLFVVLAIGVEVTLPQRLAVLPRFLLPALASAMLIALISVNPTRISRQNPRLRAASMALIGLLTVANAVSAGKLIAGLIQGTEGKEAGQLLATGGAIWLTNVIVFALWYWELDRGGPAARANAQRNYPDFLFPQMENPHLASEDWEPGFVDYLYLSFTNGTAFSPTDVLPLTRWTKMTMLVQEAVSLSTVALVIARAVNILQ
jgi:uncharacterized membrane protein